jgi:hypothetical protein
MTAVIQADKRKKNERCNIARFYLYAIILHCEAISAPTAPACIRIDEVKTLSIQSVRKIKRGIAEI